MLILYLSIILSLNKYSNKFKYAISKNRSESLIVKKRELSKTMRIDIHPDFLGQSLARKKVSLGVDAAASLDESRIGEVSDNYGKLLECIYDAVLITDPSGLIVDVNTRTVDFFLSPRDTLLGSNVVDLISGSDNSLLSSIGSNLDEHRHTLIEAYCIRTDKSMFPAEIAVNEICLDNGGRLCFLVRDISIRKGVQDELEDAVARLEEHDRARTQFVSNVSHELRTPLTSMIYAVSNMLRGVLGPLPARLQDYLEMLYGDCKRLSGTVNDILDLSKIDNRTLTLTKANVPFFAFVSRSIKSLQLQAKQKGVHLRLREPAGSWFVECDSHKMERVVFNIVGNAVKFTPRNGVVDVEIKESPEYPGYVILSVRDSGIGIPEDAIEQVTERYFTVGEQASGSGLGLAISKEIVESHEGRLTVESPPHGYEKGTVVSIMIPVATPPRVLAVDDSKEILSLLTEQLSGEGYDVICASGGAEALRLLAEGKGDLVVLDLLLPDLQGTEVILKMREDPVLMKIPVIVVSESNIGEAKSHLLNSFSVPSLSKPWKRAEFLDLVSGAFLGKGAIG